MSNWFQNHPVTAIISHTALVAGVTWAALYFVVDENKVSFYKARADNADSVSIQLNAKISVLETEIQRLRTENERYLGWLTQDPKSFPSMSLKIAALEREVYEANGAGTKYSGDHKISEERLYELYKSFNRGQSFVDPKTKATIGISDITSDHKASGVLTLPGDQTILINDVGAGKVWRFEDKGKHYQLTMDSVNWINNSVEASVVELPE